MNIIEEVLVENMFADPMPCRVHECGEPFVDFDSKLCVEHWGELIEDQQYKYGV